MGRALAEDTVSMTFESLCAAVTEVGPPRKLGGGGPMRPGPPMPRKRPVGITRPCTKHNWLVKDTADLSSKIHQAFHVASAGRPGPVLVDIPKDVQFASAEYTPKPKAPVG